MFADFNNEDLLKDFEEDLRCKLIEKGADVIAVVNFDLFNVIKNKIARIYEYYDMGDITTTDKFRYLGLEVIPSQHEVKYSFYLKF